MMGSVDRNKREDFVNLMDSVVHRDETKATRVLLKITIWEDEPDILSLERELGDFMGQHLYKPLKEIQIGRLIQQLLELTSRHHLRIPPDIFLMMKGFSTVEGVALMLDPNFNMIAEIAPFIERVKLEKILPRKDGKRCEPDGIGSVSIHEAIPQRNAGNFTSDPAKETYISV